ncbi:MAG: Nif3-like dinuclear metal center hexameric protein [Burkholderiaceae bacterium]|nr:MAG: Nif3-like dinuclear metal center hexameric protein [Burkholderiaceae bacterium]
MTVDREILLATFNEMLQPERFQDYGPNGLQVEGRRAIGKLVSGVTASRAFIDAATDAGADAVFVHHGLFWRGQKVVLTGWLKERVKRLLACDISLFAYHLPLDAHRELGNNAQLGRVLGLTPQSTFGAQDLGMMGERTTGGAFDRAASLAQHLELTLNRNVIAVGEPAHPIRRIAWCTGGAQNYFEAAIDAGADAFITGEISEPQAHLARECHVAFFACGHHATERYGAPALAGAVAARFGIAHEFIDIDNPA